MQFPEPGTTFRAALFCVFAVPTSLAFAQPPGKSSDGAAETLRAEFAKKYPDWAQPLLTHTAVTRIWKELP